MKNKPIIDKQEQQLFSRIFNDFIGLVLDRTQKGGKLVTLTDKSVEVDLKFSGYDDKRDVIVIAPKNQSAFEQLTRTEVGNKGVDLDNLSTYEIVGEFIKLFCRYNLFIQMEVAEHQKIPNFKPEDFRDDFIFKYGSSELDVGPSLNEQIAKLGIKYQDKLIIDKKTGKHKPVAVAITPFGDAVDIKTASEVKGSGDRTITKIPVESDETTTVEVKNTEVEKTEVENNKPTQSPTTNQKDNQEENKEKPEGPTVPQLIDQLSKLSWLSWMVSVLGHIFLNSVVFFERISLGFTVLIAGAIIFLSSTVTIGKSRYDKQHGYFVDTTRLVFQIKATKIWTAIVGVLVVGFILFASFVK